jgi:hypothetical protein
VDNSVAMRSAYDRINVGDIDGFGELIAENFVEHEESAGLPPHQGWRARVFEAWSPRSQTGTWTSRI